MRYNAGPANQDNATVSNEYESATAPPLQLDAPPTPDDLELAARFRHGDAQAFDVLLRRHQDRVFHLLYWFLGDASDAEDVAQEVWVRVYFALESFRGEAAFGTWLHHIALNLGRNRLRARNRKGRNRAVRLDPARHDRHSTTQDGPREQATAAETEAQLWRCLEALDERWRVPFVLRVMEGHSYQEIAGLVRVRLGTVKSRLNEARQRLRRCLEQADAI